MNTFTFITVLLVWLSPGQPDHSFPRADMETCQAELPEMLSLPNVVQALCYEVPMLVAPPPADPQA